MYQRAQLWLGRVLMLDDLLPCPFNLLHHPNSWFDVFVSLEGQPSNMAEWRDAALVLGSSGRWCV
jgi:hypothetical protein